MAGDGGVQWPDQAALDTWNRVHEVAAWVGGSEALTTAILTPLGAWVVGQPVAAQPARIRDLAAITPVTAVTTFRGAQIVMGPAVQGVVPTRPINLIELAQAILIYRVCRRRVGADDADPTPVWDAAQTAA